MTTTLAVPVGTWVLDPARAAVSFSGRAGVLAPTFRAAFTSVAGVVEVGEQALLQVDVDVTSIGTGNRHWDDLLRGLDPFDAARCPLATYRGVVDLVIADRAHIDGELELRGVRQPVSLAAQLRPDGEEVRVTATGTVDRRAFGVRCDLPGVSRFVPSVMRLDIEVTAVRAGKVPRQR